MKKSIIFLTLFAIFSNSYAQNDSIRKPIECGTGRIIAEMKKENQKIIEDFIAASEKDPMFGNGMWWNIGKQNTDKEILKAGLQGYNWEKDNIQILKSIDGKNCRYILFSHQKGGVFPVKLMALYDKTSFRTYDAFTYQNHYHPEVLGKWKMSEAFSKKGNKELTLKLIPDELFDGYVLEIKEDYTFEMSQSGCGNECDLQIKGNYSFNNKGISFNCYDIQYLGEKKKGKPFVSGPFAFTKEENILILKK